MNMIVYISLTCLVFMSVISLVYLIKPKIKNLDNKIFSNMLLITIAILILEIIGTSITNIDYLQLKIWLKKIYMVFTICWGCLLIAWCLATGNPNKKFNYKRNSAILGIIFATLTIILPLEFTFDSNDIVKYVTGPSSYVLATFILLFIIFLINYLITKKNTLKEKVIPIYTLIVLMVISSFIQIIIPEFLLMTLVISTVNLLLFLTIENPDIKMLKQVELSKDTAEKANRAKTDFLSSMSHEIRTPLNAIVGFSQMIESVEQLDEAKENAKDIISAANTLLEIVNGILDVSKIEAGKMEIVNTNYNPTKLFEEVTKLLAIKIQSKSLEFNIKIAQDLPEILYGDAVNLKKIVTNLLSNAYKYTDYGYINFNISCINAKDICRMMICIEDSGRGIKEEDINKLFTKFNRLDVDKNTTTEGTGLGLAITKQLTELMGGKILVDSKFGEGSKFTVIINQRINEVEPIKNESIKYDKINLKDKNILIVDDNPLNLKVAEKLLKKYGPKITTIDNGFDCIKLVKEQYFDLILLDDMMPKLSGKETFERLKKLQGFESIVIVLTANAIHGMEQNYLNLGFNGYIAKPIELNKMIKTIEKAFYYKKNKKINFGELPNEIFEINEKENQMD